MWHVSPKVNGLVLIIRRSRSIVWSCSKGVFGPQWQERGGAFLFSFLSLLKEAEPNFVLPLSTAWSGLQEADNSSSEPESIVSGPSCLGRSETRERWKDGWRGVEVKRQRSLASGRCSIHPTEETLLHLNGLFGCSKPGMLMCHRSWQQDQRSHSGPRHGSRSFSDLLIVRKHKTRWRSGCDDGSYWSG